MTSIEIESLNRLGAVQELRVNGHETLTSITLTRDADPFSGDKEWASHQGEALTRLHLKNPTQDLRNNVRGKLMDADVTIAEEYPERNSKAEGAAFFTIYPLHLERALKSLDMDTDTIEIVSAMEKHGRMQRSHFISNLEPADIKRLNNTELTNLDDADRAAAEAARAAGEKVPESQRLVKADGARYMKPATHAERVRETVGQVLRR